MNRRFISLQDKAKRLLIPYVIWSLVYLISRLLIYILSQDINSIQQLIKSYINIIFMGGAAVHLYFIPILFIGICFASLLVKFKLHKQRPAVLIAILCLAIVLNIGLSFTQNQYKIGGFAFESFLKILPVSVGENPIVKLLFVFLAWAIRCFPLIMMAMILASPHINQKIIQRTYSRQSTIIICAIAIALPFLKDYLPKGITETLLGYCWLIAAVALSRYLQDLYWLGMLGKLTFGIYLSHHLFIEILSIPLAKIYPEFMREMSVGVLFALSACSFVLSLLLIRFLRQRRQLAWFT